MGTNAMDSHHLIHVCYEKAKEKLKNNASEYGLLASSPDSIEGKAKNYTALYTRDIGVSAFGILSAKEEEFYPIIKTSLISLTNAQSPLGQFPFYFKPEEEKTQWRDSGSLDSTLWWCIAFLLYYQTTHDEEFYKEYRPHLKKAFTWLSYQDVNNDSLLEQGEAADWADELPRHGMVLYSNALWYWATKLHSIIRPDNDQHLQEYKIHEAFNTLFWIHKVKDSNVSYIPNNDYTRKNTFAKGLLEYINSQAVFLPYYLGFVAHKDFEMRCDSFGNLLALLTGLADEQKAKMITDSIIRFGMNSPYPLNALYPVIYPGEEDWRDYMAKGRQNYPHQYHNGGIWPFLGGFWVLWLARVNKKLAHHELLKLATANSLNDFEFNEYLHGKQGTPMGVPNQTWSMTMYLAAYHAVVDHE